MGLEAGRDVANRAGRQRQAVVDGDVRTGELAVAGDRQLIDVQVATPLDAIRVPRDLHRLGINGRTIEVEHGPVGERQGVEAIGLPGLQGGQAVAAAPGGILVITGCGGESAGTRQVVLATKGGEIAWLGREIIRIADECEILEWTGQSAADVAAGNPGTPVPVTAVIAIGVGLDGFAKEGVIGVHGGAGDPALATHG
ncbi:hypothetical protein D3C77_136570 [compost metagenome]